MRIHAEQAGHYGGGLLSLALDLGNRLLRAFPQVYPSAHLDTMTCRPFRRLTGLSYLLLSAGTKRPSCQKEAAAQHGLQWHALGMGQLEAWSEQNRDY